MAQGNVLNGELPVAAAEEREEAKQVEQRADHGMAIVSGSDARDQPVVRRMGFWRRTRLAIEWSGAERNLSLLYHIRFWCHVLRERPGPISIRAGDQTMELSAQPATSRRMTRPPWDLQLASRPRSSPQFLERRPRLLQPEPHVHLAVHQRSPRGREAGIRQ